jgi:hypothetical protein
MKAHLILLLLFVSFSMRGQESNVSVNPALKLLLRAVRASQPIPSDQLLILSGTETDKGTPVLLFEPLKSEALKSLFPDITTYRLFSSNDPLHDGHISSLVIPAGGGQPRHLKSDEQVAQFVGELAGTIQSTEEAKRLIQTFAELRGYFLVEKPPDTPDARKPSEIPMPVDTDYKFIAEEHKSHWRVYATFLTHGHSGSIHRYEFKLYKSPGSGLAISDPVMIHLRTYVF